MPGKTIYAEGLVLNSSLVSPKLQLFKTPYEELGVYAIEPLKAGEIAIILIGEIITESRLDRLPRNLQKYPLQVSDEHYLGWTKNLNLTWPSTLITAVSLIWVF